MRRHLRFRADGRRTKRRLFNKKCLLFIEKLYKMFRLRFAPLNMTALETGYELKVPSAVADGTMSFYNRNRVSRLTAFFSRLFIPGRRR